MPQYLAPGVYVEEIPGPRTIQGVSTSTAAFVGPTRFGPTSGRPELLTSYLDFARIYGDAANLTFTDNGTATNYLALSVKGFFDEGGSSLYVARTYAPSDTPANDNASKAQGAVTVRSRFPGAMGAALVTFSLKVGNNVASGSTLTRVHEYDVVWATGGAASTGDVYVVRRDATGTLFLTDDGTTVLALASVTAGQLTVDVSIQFPTTNGQGLPSLTAPASLGTFGFDPRAIGTGLSTVLAANPPLPSQALTVPIEVDVSGVSGTNEAKAINIVKALFTTPDSAQSVQLTLANGTDGNAPDSNAYATALETLEPIDDISIVAAPGASSGWVATGSDPTATAQAINGVVTTHAENMIYRVAALDVPSGKTPGDALDFRNLRSSDHAAIYYPWLTVSHPIDGSRVLVPPAAYAAGIWARTDNARGPIKAPANETVRSALDLELRINKAQQELLNPQGVNCLRYFPGPGFLVWGARTIADDPEWKYLNIRRYFNYLEKSIDEGTQWVVFEVNGPALWDSVRHTVEGFLLNEWRSGALLGSKPEQGFFVKCDASTMTPDDLDNGRLICIIGVAAAKPAEFVIFRISQITAQLGS